MQAKGIAQFGLLCSLSIFTGLSHAMMVSDLLITEVMANPDALSDTRGEWFELYNPTTEEINLRSLTIGDDGSDLHRIESDLLILPGEYLTLARYFDPGFTPDYVYDGFTLSNSGDEIVFSDGISELLRLDYGSDFDVAGRSRELVGLPMIASNYDLTLASLSYGFGDIGTPGEAGSFIFPVLKEPLPDSAVPLPGTVWLFIAGILSLLTSILLSRRHKLFTQSIDPPSWYMSSYGPTTESSRYFGPPPPESSSPRKRGSHNMQPRPASSMITGPV